MTDTEKLNLRVGKLEDLLVAKLRLRGKTLTSRLRRAGRLLPKHARKAGAEIVAAQSRMANPKLARLVDQPALDRAFAILHEHLDGIDPAERRKDALVGLAGSVVFNLMLLAAAVVAVLWWQRVI